MTKVTEVVPDWFCDCTVFICCLSYTDGLPEFRFELSHVQVAALFVSQNTKQNLNKSTKVTPTDLVLFLKLFVFLVLVEADTQFILSPVCGGVNSRVNT